MMQSTNALSVLWSIETGDCVPLSKSCCMLGRVRWELRWTSGRVLLALLRSAVLSLVFARSKEEGIVFSEVWSSRICTSLQHKEHHFDHLWSKGGKVTRFKNTHSTPAYKTQGIPDRTLFRTPFNLEMGCSSYLWLSLYRFIINFSSPFLT